jgi:membrane-associated phospholipid phosphatase
MASSRLNLQLLSLIGIPEFRGKGMKQLPKLRKPELSKWLVIRWFLGFALILGLVAVFTELAEDVWFREGFAWDAPIILAIHQFSRPWLDTVMRAVTQAGESVAIAVAILMAAWFGWKHKVLDAISIIISISGSAALNALLKILLKRPRPVLFPPLVVASGFSFPSGHVTTSVAVYGFLAVLLWRNNHRGWAILSGTLVLAVAFSRIYLGVHYPSDTLGAMIFASLWLMVIFAIHDRYVRQVEQSSA